MLSMFLMFHELKFFQDCFFCQNSCTFLSSKKSFNIKTASLLKGNMDQVSLFPFLWCLVVKKRARCLNAFPLSIVDGLT